jgi:hypothetical protein
VDRKHSDLARLLKNFTPTSTGVGTLVKRQETMSKFTIRSSYPAILQLPSTLVNNCAVRLRLLRIAKLQLGRSLHILERSQTRAIANIM